MLSSGRRRAEILAIMNVRKHDTIDNLAFEFDVSRRTMIKDIQVLSISSSIYTVSGRYGGGVYASDDYNTRESYLTSEQANLLTQLSETLDINSQAIIRSILKSFSAPK